MVTLLICMIPVCIIATGFLALKSVQLGLKWQIQTADKKEPEFKDPIDRVFEAVRQTQADKANNYTAQQIEEYSPFYEEV